MNDTFYEDDFLYIFNGCCAKENKTDDTNFQHSVTAESYNSRTAETQIHGVS